MQLVCILTAKVPVNHASKVQTDSPAQTPKLTLKFKPKHTTYIHANSLATASSYAHLAEPGCLCTKKVCTVSRASKATGAGLELAREQAFPHSKWCGQPKSHLDHCCCMRKGLEFAPQQMPGTQSQLGGLLVGRWKIRWKNA